MKISVIIPVLNDPRIVRALDSLFLQQHDHELEVVVVDGVSSDQTLKLVDGYRERISVLVSEPDDGIFDAVNKGIALCSGTADDVVHYLAANDMYADPYVFRDVMDCLQRNDLDGCYGDQVYADPSGNIVRYWKSGEARRWKRYYGWTPPHPAVFLRRKVYQRLGVFDLRYPIASDYDFFTRLFFESDANMRYLERVLMIMAPGGTSGKSAWTIAKANAEVASAVWNNRRHMCLLAPLLKPLRKLNQVYRSAPTGLDPRWTVT